MLSKIVLYLNMKSKHNCLDACGMFNLGQNSGKPNWDFAGPRRTDRPTDRTLKTICCFGKWVTVVYREDKVLTKRGIDSWRAVGFVARPGGEALTWSCTCVKYTRCAMPWQGSSGQVQLCPSYKPLGPRPFLPCVARNMPELPDVHGFPCKLCNVFIFRKVPLGAV